MLEFGVEELDIAPELSVDGVAVEFVLVLSVELLVCATATPPAMPTALNATAVSFRIAFMFSLRSVTAHAIVDFFLPAMPMPSTGARHHQGDPTEPRYDAQVKILHELLAQHFEEERTELFPRVRSASLDLEEIGAEMAARQEVLLSADEEADAV
jgi:hypothetical protein